MDTQTVPSDTPAPDALPIGTSFRIALDGLCSVNGGQDEACTIVELSLDHVAVRSAATVAVADEVILSLPRIGLVKASVAQAVPGRFDLTFEPAIQSKLGTYMRWLVRRAHGEADGRAHPRIVPIMKLVTLARDAEPESMARIVDLSCSGVAFTTSKTLEMDEGVMIGKHEARITRLFEGGAAAQFAQPLPEDGFDVMIDLNRRDMDDVPMVGDESAAARD
jgi:hypothetical protein